MHKTTPTPFRRTLVLALASAMLGTAIAAPAQTQRVYFIGNSVTDTVRYGELAKLAAARDVMLDWGRTMIPGAPLEWIYTHPNDGFQQEPYGRWKQALNDFAWDAISLQPFDRQLHGKDKDGKDLGDAALIKEWAEMAARKNSDVQICIYARWPRVTSGGKGVPFDKNDYDPAKPGSGNDLSKVDDFTARWTAKYTGGWDNSNETCDYFDQLLAEVRKETPFLKKPPLLVPVGHVMNELHTQMKAGKVPGYTSIYQFYKDGIHLNEAGSYLVGCIYFATLLKQSPVGLPTAPYGKIDPALAETIQKTVWQIVTAHPGAGVKSRTPAADARGLRTLPYPPGKILAGLEWTSEPHLYPNIESDMHWQTWGADDAIYSVDGDGNFFGTGDYFCSLSRIIGMPLDHRIQLVTQFKELDLRAHAPAGRQRYLCGPVAVGTDLYVCIYDYDWRIAGKDVSQRQEMLAVDRYSKHGGIPAILHSRDGGKTWSNGPKKDTPRFLGPNYGNLQFVGFGPGYSRVPEQLGNFVYAISNDSNWESGDHLYLARVPRDKILERPAWAFFSGTSEAPAWSSEEGAAKPIFRDLRHVGHSDMTYNPGLKRYLLTVFSDTVPHLETATVADTKAWEKQTELQLYEGPTPWGPWALVYNENPWGGPDHACYLPHLPAKWLGKDGLTGWMLYSGDWEHEHYPKREYYGYMTRGFRLVPKAQAGK